MSKKKILVIDDDRVLILLLNRRISEAGYEVISAFDGVQGLRLAFQKNPALILLDIRFPAGGGIETLKKLNTSMKTMNIPIIIITSYDDPQIREQTSEYNVLEYMLKPLDIEKLLTKIREIIGEAN